MKNNKQIIFYICVGISVLIIGYFGLFLNLNEKTENETSNTNPETKTVENTVTKQGGVISSDNKQVEQDNKNPQQTDNKDLNDTQPTTTVQNTQNDVTNSKQQIENKQLTKAFEGIKILKSEVSSTAKFYPYQAGDIYMEVIAVKATDGTIRTALNTCQVCFDSGRGFYKQEGEFLVCQNCRNRFHIDQVELVKGGCNPVPVLEDNKKDLGDSIAIGKDFLLSQKDYFAEWKR